MVCAKKRLSNKVEEGVIGVVVHVYSQNVYEVEFMDENMNFIDLITVNEEEIEMMINN